MECAFDDNLSSPVCPASARSCCLRRPRLDRPLTGFLYQRHVARKTLLRLQPWPEMAIRQRCFGLKQPQADDDLLFDGEPTGRDSGWLKHLWPTWRDRMADGGLVTRCEFSGLLPPSYSPPSRNILGDACAGFLGRADHLGKGRTDQPVGFGRRAFLEPSAFLCCSGALNSWLHLVSRHQLRRSQFLGYFCGLEDLHNNVGRFTFG